MEQNVEHDRQWKIINPYFEYSGSFEDNSTPWAGHKCFSYNLIRNLEPSLVVELCTWKVSSFYSFCQAVKDIKGKTKLVAIDTWQGDSHAGKYTDEVFDTFKEILSKYYKDVPAGFIRKTFDDAVADFEDGTIDILHIDGFHTYEAVSKDFNTWKSKLKKDAIVLFHDISEHREGFGVYKFWAEVKSSYKTLEFTHSHGLGILFNSDKRYDIIAPTFASDQLKCLQYSYEATKDELRDDQVKIRELAEIKVSRYWLMKERVKKLLGKG